MVRHPLEHPCGDEDETWVQGLYSDGNVNLNSCTNTRGSRPAFLIPSNYAVEDESNPLAQYTVNELIAEVNRRMCEEA